MAIASVPKALSAATPIKIDNASALLVIDEPMVGLDALAQKQVKLLLRRLVSEQKTIFMTTHTMSVAEAVCDRIGILHRGRMVASGTTAELKSNRALEDVFLELTYGND